MKYTDKDVEKLADAMWQVLDDMGKDGLSVCPLAKAEARIALQAFPQGSDELAYTFEEAKALGEDLLGPGQI